MPSAAVSLVQLACIAAPDQPSFMCMSVDVVERVPALLKVLAEPVRWRIVERLTAEELCVCHLAEDLGLAQPLVSHHLKVLRGAGMVDSERFRQWTYYRLVPEVLTELADLLGRVGRQCPPAGHHRRPCR